MIPAAVYEDMKYFVKDLSNVGRVFEDDIIERFAEFSGRWYENGDVTEMKQLLLGLCVEHDIRIIPGSEHRPQLKYITRTRSDGSTDEISVQPNRDYTVIWTTKENPDYINVSRRMHFTDMKENCLHMHDGFSDPIYFTGETADKYISKKIVLNIMIEEAFNKHLATFFRVR